MSSRPLPGSIVLLIAFFAAKLIWDVVLIVQTWPPGSPDFSYPKLGIATVLPVLIWGLTRNMNWALNLAGVACLFWITFVVARLVIPILTMPSDEARPFPWSNLLAFPAIVLVINNLKTDEELSATG